MLVPLLLLSFALAPGEADPLDGLLAAARERNREILAARAYAEAADARVRPAGSLEDPTLGLGYADMFENFPQYGKDPFSQILVEVEQMFPGAGQRQARREIARHMASHHAAEVRAVALRVESEVRRAWWDLYRIHAEREILERARENLRSFTAGVEARYRAGEGDQAEVLRAGVEINLATERLRMLEREDRGARARLNALLDRDPGADLPAPPSRGDTRPLGRLALGTEDLVLRARDSCPLIVGMQHLVMHREAGVRLARAERNPDWGVRGGIFPRGRIDAMWMLGLRISLPIRPRDRQDEWMREARAELSGAENDLAAHTRDVEARIADLAAMSAAARDLVDLYDAAVLPQAELAVLSGVAGYESGRTSFQTVLTSLVALRQHETERVRRRSEFHQSVAELEALVGERLPVRP